MIRSKKLLLSNGRLFNKYGLSLDPITLVVSLNNISDADKDKLSLQNTFCVIVSKSESYCLQYLCKDEWKQFNLFASQI